MEYVCNIENCSWSTLGNNIDSIVKTYDWRGEKEDKGNEGHRTVINALKRFKECIDFYQNNENVTQLSVNKIDYPDRELTANFSGLRNTHPQNGFVKIDKDILDWIHALGGEPEIWINQILRQQIKNAATHLK